MPYTVGIVLALLTALLARLAGLDRDRAFYPTALIVVASYYVLFAVMGGSTHALIVESIATTVFAAVAVAGFRSSLWLVAVALAGHGAFDLIHPRLVSNPGVPAWWPAFCLAYDFCIAAVFALLLRARVVRTRAARPG
jgi:hypothetical protein